MRRLIIYDWKNGILHAWHRYLLAGILILFLCMGQMQQVQEGVKAGLYSAPSFGNYLAVWLKGMKEINGLVKVRHLKLPAEWLTLQLCHIFLLAGYVRTDLVNNGSRLMLRVGNRTSWWAGKCIWAVIGTAVYYLIFYGILAAVSCMTGSLDIMPRSQVWVSDLAYPADGLLVLSVFVFPPLSSMSAGLFQVLAELVSSPALALALSCGYQFAVLYWCSPLLAGNYAMLYRSGNITGSARGSVISGICLCIMLAGCFYAAGRRYIKKMEF